MQWSLKVLVVAVEYVLGEKEKEGALDDEQDGENEN